MQYITIVTPDNIEIRYRLAGAGSRAAAAVMDLLLQAFIYLLFAVPLVYFTLGGFGGFSLDLSALGWGAGLLIAGFFAIAFGYYITAELLLNGRTVGKIVYGLRAIRENGAPLSAVHSLIRTVFKLTIDFPGVGLILIMFTRKCKRIGDVAASTVVIAEARREPVARVGADNPLSSIADTTDDVIKLSNDEAALLKLYFARRPTLTDSGAAIRKALVVRLSCKYSLPEDTIDDDMLEKILNANL